MWMKGKGDVVTYILRENLKKNHGSNFRDLFNQRSGMQTPIRSKFSLNFNKAFSRMTSNFSTDSNPLSIESRKSKRMGKRILSLSGSKSRHRFGFFSKLQNSFGAKNKKDEAPKKKDKKKKNLFNKRTKEFEEFYIENLLRSNKIFTKICLLFTALDCFVRGITAIFETSMVGQLVYLRVADFTLSTVFILNFYLIQYGTKAQVVKNVIYFGFLARLASLLTEYFLVLKIQNGHR